MENNQYQKWVNLSYLALAALVAYVVFALSQKVITTYDVEAKVRSIDLIIRVLSIGIAGLIFLVMYRNERSNQFMNEVVAELSRVTWPTQKETTSATGIVIIMVLISGMVLGFLDYVWTTLIQWIL